MNNLTVGDKCPRCGGEIEEIQIPCPDGREGCLVMHFAARCANCNYPESDSRLNRPITVGMLLDALGIQR
jgi:C4-type Zn-finger protein